MVVCTLPFSCSNKGGDSTPISEATFWTKNSASLTACSNSIVIRVTINSTGVFVANATITTLSSAAPSGCDGSASLRLSYGVNYRATASACAGGGSSSFTLAPDECLKIEI